MDELTPDELALLKDACCGLHISCVFHRPEYLSLTKKGLITLEDQARVWWKPSYYVVRTQAGKDLLAELKKPR